MIAGKKIVIGVCGGIAAYKAAALTSKLVQADAQVRVIMTASAQQFITPLTFQTLSKHHVYIDTFDEADPASISHIALADEADACIIAPATAHVIAKLAHGLADDMLCTTLLATRAPIFIAPAMNVHMFANIIVQQNIQKLSERGIHFIEPEDGPLACGYVGKGRLAEPEDIVQVLEDYFAESLSWSGRKVLVTAGGTIERIDPVRYITNDSSGKMGYSLAEEAVRKGAHVTLITTPTALTPPSGAEVVSVVSALDMHEAVRSRFIDMDVILMAAAVADYRPVSPASQKIKKKDAHLYIELTKNPDILQEIGEQKSHQFLVGFAAETEHLAQHAMEKLARKHCDLLIANDVTQVGAGFRVDTNIVHIFDQHGCVDVYPLLSKREISRRILALIDQRLASSPAQTKRIPSSTVSRSQLGEYQ